MRKVGRRGSLEPRILGELAGRCRVPPLLAPVRSDDADTDARRHCGDGDDEGSSSAEGSPVKAPSLPRAIEMPYLADRRVQSVAELRVLARDVAQALAVLHEAGYVHCDMKRRNLRFDGERAWLIDFDLACEVPPGGRLHGPAGTPGWRAPEVVAGEAYDGRAADLWGLGLVLFDELLAVNLDLSGALSTSSFPSPPPPSPPSRRCERETTRAGSNTAPCAVTSFLGVEYGALSVLSFWPDRFQRLKPGVYFTSLMVSLTKADPAQRPTAVEALAHRGLRRKV